MGFFRILVVANGQTESGCEPPTSAFKLGFTICHQYQCEVEPLSVKNSLSHKKRYLAGVTEKSMVEHSASRHRTKRQAIYTVKHVRHR